MLFNHLRIVDDHAHARARAHHEEDQRLLVTDHAPVSVIAILAHAVHADTLVLVAHEDLILPGVLPVQEREDHVIVHADRHLDLRYSLHQDRALYLLRIDLDGKLTKLDLGWYYPRNNHVSVELLRYLTNSCNVMQHCRAPYTAQKWEVLIYLGKSMKIRQWINFVAFILHNLHRWSTIIILLSL
ncbi:hypothetical protein TrispH2_004329 [Trichoplax sp. H2]|nr:hypothetical protein TrispH2_004329 [Trichoplax sp. H2]|eukprot:RDD44522.1 hypothetical protein TrispH2_004329 [Trichoplax sp. H2]